MKRLCDNFKAPIHSRIQSYDRIGGYGTWQMKSIKIYDDDLPSRTTDSDNGSWILGVEHSRRSKCVSSKRLNVFLPLLLLYLGRMDAGWGEGGMATRAHMCQLMCHQSVAFLNCLRPFSFQNTKNTLTNCTKASMR